MADIFDVIADPTRRDILRVLLDRNTEATHSVGEISVSEIVATLELSQPTVSKHLKVLESAGLVTRGRDGTRRPVRAVTKPLRQATAWLDAFCAKLEGNYQRLDGLLEEMKAVQKDHP